MKEDTVNKEFSELYNQLVPIAGMCKTRNGELLRVARKLEYKYSTTNNSDSLVNGKIRPLYNTWLRLLEEEMKGFSTTPSEIRKHISKGTACNGVYEVLKRDVVKFCKENEDTKLPKWYENKIKEQFSL